MGVCAPLTTVNTRRKHFDGPSGVDPFSSSNEIINIGCKSWLFLICKTDRSCVNMLLHRSREFKGGENISSENDRIEEWKFRKFKTWWKITQISSFVENPARVFNKKKRLTRLIRFHPITRADVFFLIPKQYFASLPYTLDDESSRKARYI